jgi:hypothetical protein
MPSIEYIVEDSDLVDPEPLPEMLRQCLKREKIMKVRLPKLYYRKNLKEWKNFTTG